MSCDNIFIDGCKSINEIRLAIIEKVSGNDVERILDGLKKIKDKRWKDPQRGEWHAVKRVLYSHNVMTIILRRLNDLRESR